MINLYIGIMIGLIVGVIAGIYLHKNFRRKSLIEATAETIEMDGRIYKLGFLYDPKNDKDCQEFMLQAKYIGKAFKNAFDVLDKEGVKCHE